MVWSLTKSFTIVAPLKVCLGSVYFAKTENFFAESTVDKGKS